MFVLPHRRWLESGGTVTEPAKARDAVVERLRVALRHAGFEDISSEKDAERSLVVGAGGRWVFTGDSASSDDWTSPGGYDALSRDLSTIGAVVDVKMSDDAAVHFYLHRHGRLIDQFGNSAFPFFRFASEEEAAPYRGRPELWSDLLVSPDATRTLRSVWVQERSATDILTQTGKLFGWHPQLTWVGYTSDNEGIPTKYDEYLKELGVEVEGFTELHFKRPQVIE